MSDANELKNYNEILTAQGDAGSAQGIVLAQIRDQLHDIARSLAKIAGVAGQIPWRHPRHGCRGPTAQGGTSTWRVLMLSGLAVAVLGCTGPRVLVFHANRVVATPNGQLVVKGFGSSKAASVVCTVSPGPYGSDRSNKTETSVDVLDYVSGKVSQETANRVVLLYSQTEKLAALDTVMTQVCMAYGNGAFGEVGSHAAESRYFTQVNDLIDKFSHDALPAAPTGDRGEQAGAEGKTGDEAAVATAEADRVKADAASEAARRAAEDLAPDSLKAEADRLRKKNCGSLAKEKNEVSEKVKSGPADKKGYHQRMLGLIDAARDEKKCR